MSRTTLGKTLIAFAIIASVVFGAWWVIRSQFESSEVIRDRFMNHSTRLSPLRRLQLAQLDQVEVFERTSVATLFGNRLKLPDVIVRATMPVEYTYHVDFSQPWNFDVRGEQLIVTAPILTPGTPAGDVSQLKFEIRKGSIFRDEQAVARAMQDQMTELLKGRAENNLHLVRETARKELQSLVHSWMKSEQKNWVVTIRFADEANTGNP